MTMIPLEERTRARRLSPQSLSRPGALLQRISASAGHFLHAARLSCGHAFLPRTHPRTPAPPAGKPARRAGPPLLRNRPADPRRGAVVLRAAVRSEEHTSELQSLMRISYAVFCLKKH